MRTRSPHTPVTPKIAEISPHPSSLKSVPPRNNAAYLTLKRITDTGLSLTAIVLLSPLLCLIAIIIKLNDGGPILFVQTRVGFQQQTFKMYKFRTMRTDAEEVLAEVLAQADNSEEQAGNQVLFKLKDDPRITRPGKFLRQFSLDELPQLFNVIRGEMSLIGPRPPLPREVANFDSEALRKFDALPGLTGLWQTMGRSNLSWEEAITLDLHYVDHFDFKMDVCIFFRTFKAVLSREGAY